MAPGGVPCAAAGVDSASTASAVNIIDRFTIVPPPSSQFDASIDADWGAATAALLRLCGEFDELIDLVRAGGKRGHQPDQALVRLLRRCKALTPPHIIAGAGSLQPRFDNF